MNKLLAIRKGFGINQTEMAVVLGCSVRTYISKEKDPSKFNGNEIKKIIEYFQVLDNKIEYADLF